MHIFLCTIKRTVDPDISSMCGTTRASLGGSQSICITQCKFRSSRKPSSCSHDVGSFLLPPWSMDSDTGDMGDSWKGAPRPRALHRDITGRFAIPLTPDRPPFFLSVTPRLTSRTAHVHQPEGATIQTDTLALQVHFRLNLTPYPCPVRPPKRPPVDKRGGKRQGKSQRVRQPLRPLRPLPVLRPRMLPDS